MEGGGGGKRREGVEEWKEGKREGRMESGKKMERSENGGGMEVKRWEVRQQMSQGCVCI